MLSKQLSISRLARKRYEEEKLKQEDEEAARKAKEEAERRAKEAEESKIKQDQGILMLFAFF